MKNLKNKKTGQIITFVKVTSDNKVVYNFYDNGIDLEHGKIFESKIIPLMTNFVPDSPLSFDELKNYSALKTIEVTETDFEICEDLENWFFLKGSTGIDTTLRVLIPNDLIVSELQDSTSQFGDMLVAMRPLSDWSCKGNLSTVQYLEELLEPQKSLIESYADKGVIIDYKA